MKTNIWNHGIVDEMEIWVPHHCHNMKIANCIKLEIGKESFFLAIEDKFLPKMVVSSWIFVCLFVYF